MDKFVTGLQLPNIEAGQAANPDPGFIRIYGKNDKLYGVLPSGVEVLLSDEGTVQEVYINETPEIATPAIAFVDDGTGKFTMKVNR